MASGSTSRRSRRPRPGKRYMVMSQAVPVPNSSVSAPTPTSSRPVSASAPGSTVRIRCGHTLSAGSSESTTIVASGSAMMPASTAANTVQPGDTLQRSPPARQMGRKPPRLSCHLAQARSSAHWERLTAWGVKTRNGKSGRLLMRRSPARAAEHSCRAPSQATRAGAYTGTTRSLPKEMVTRVPRPGALSMASAAPLAAASARVRGRPRPSPSGSVFGASRHAGPRIGDGDGERAIDSIGGGDRYAIARPRELDGIGQ